LDEGHHAGAGDRFELGNVPQGLPALIGFLQPGLQQAAGHPAKGNTGCPVAGAQELNCFAVGSPGQLQRAWRCPGGDRLQQFHGGAGGPHSDIPAHGTTIELPERPVARLAQGAKALPELPGELPATQGCGLLAAGAPLESAADRQALKGNTAGLELAQAGFGSEALKSALAQPKDDRTALQNAASIAKNIITTECVVVNKPDDEGPMGAPPQNMGGMGAMGGMM